MAGAKNHMVIMPDANKEQVISNLIGASCGAAGQRCMAISVAVFVGDARSSGFPNVQAAMAKVTPGPWDATGIRLRPADQPEGEGTRFSASSRRAKKRAPPACSTVRTARSPASRTATGSARRCSPTSNRRCRSIRKRSSGRCCWHAQVDDSRCRDRHDQREPVRQRHVDLHRPAAARRASSSTRSRSARSASTCRFRCRCRSSRSPAGSSRSSATSTRTASRRCVSTPKPRPSRRAGSTTSSAVGSNMTIKLHVNFDLTEDQQAYRDAARQFAAGELAPHAARWDEEQHLSERRHPARRRARLLRAVHAGGRWRPGPVAARREPDHRRTGRGLHVHDGIHHDSQHGAMDDRHVRLRCAEGAMVSVDGHRREARFVLPHRADARDPMPRR